MENTLRGNTPSRTDFPGNSEASLRTASSSAHAAVDSMAQAADHAARKAKPTIDRAAAMAHQAVDTAAGAAGPTADWLAEQGDRLMATQRKLVEDSCNYVSANPLKSVGIAVLAGFILSRIVLR